jgi:hypothetical protein
MIQFTSPIHSQYSPLLKASQKMASSAEQISANASPSVTFSGGLLKRTASRAEDHPKDVRQTRDWKQLQKSLQETEEHLQALGIDPQSKLPPLTDEAKQLIVLAQKDPGLVMTKLKSMAANATLDLTDLAPLAGDAVSAVFGAARFLQALSYGLPIQYPLAIAAVTGADFFLKAAGYIPDLAPSALINRGILIAGLRAKRDDILEQLEDLVTSAIAQEEG